MRHDLLAITVNDPREFDIPPIGMVDVVDPSTGDIREVRVTAAVQRKYADAAEAMRTERDTALGRTGADTIELTTDGDWLATIVSHTRRKRIQAVRGGVIKR